MAAIEGRGKSTQRQGENKRRKGTNHSNPRKMDDRGTQRKAKVDPRSSSENARNLTSRVDAPEQQGEGQQCEGAGIEGGQGPLLVSDNHTCVMAEGDVLACKDQTALGQAGLAGGVGGFAVASTPGAAAATTTSRAGSKPQQAGSNIQQQQDV